MRPLDARLVRAAGPARAALAVAVAAGCALAVCVLVQATLLSHAITGAFQRGDTLGALRATLVALLVVVGLRAGITWVAETAGRRQAARLVAELRGRALAALLAGGPIALARERSGELVTTLTQGLESLDGYFGRFLPQLVLAVLVPPLGIAYVAHVDPASGIVLAVTVPLIPVFMVLVGLTARERGERRSAALGALAAHFLDVLQGLTTLRVFGRSAAQVERIAEITDRYRRTTMGTLRLAFVSALVLETLASLGTALVAVEIGIRLVDGAVTLEAGLTALILAPEVYLPLREVGARYHACVDGLGAAGRALDIVAEAGTAAREAAAAMPPQPAGTSPAAAGTASPAPLGRAAATLGRAAATLGGAAATPRSAPATPRRAPVTPGGGPATPCSAPALLGRAPAIRFEGVSYTYPTRGIPALEDLDLDVGSGETLAVVGESGAGKSTLAALLLAFARPGAGRITVDGADLAGLPADAWRRRVGWLPQRPHLLTATVAENIRLGRPGAVDDEVRRAAAQAGADAFVEALPLGYATPIGENGVRLSAGQRRRIALARALLLDAPLLILDEPMGHLDAASRALAAQAIEATAGRRTVLLIGHERDVARHAGRVVRLTAPQPAPSVA